MENENKIEKDLRKCPDLCGTWVLLGNGERWCVPAMPLGSKCKPILERLEKVGQLQQKVVSSNDQVQSVSEYLEASLDFMAAALRINYPELTTEQVENACLLTMQHVAIFMEIVKGERDIGEVIGTPNLGESTSRTKG